MQPLNPALYALLDHVYGTPRVSHAGEKMMGSYARDPRTGKARFVVSYWGESYLLNCPFCSDTRHRLAVNHMFNMQDDEGRRNTAWLVCYNEGCLAEEDNRDDFLERLCEVGGDFSRERILPGVEVDIDKILATWPGPVARLDQLRPDHIAVQYVRSRRFDPEILGRFYNVHWCKESMDHLASQRLIIPIYMHGVMKGWQARPAYEVKNWKAPGAPLKYYTLNGTPRRHVIYNLGNARRYRTGVVVEGPTDVWAFGPMSVCTLGDTMTGFQQTTFIKEFRDHAAVLLYDEDSFEKRKTQSLSEALQEAGFEGGFVNVKLPRGKDPANFDRDFLRDYVYHEARKQGVTLSWEKRDTES